MVHGIYCIVQGKFGGGKVNKSSMICQTNKLFLIWHNYYLLNLSIQKTFSCQSDTKSKFANFPPPFLLDIYIYIYIYIMVRMYIAAWKTI